MELIRSFLSEAEELLTRINEEILAFESNPDDEERLNQIFRAAHTLKGSSNLYGFSGIAVLTHLLEGILEEIQEGTRQMETRLTDLLLESFDQVRWLVQQIENGQEDPQAEPDLLHRLRQAAKQEEWLDLEYTGLTLQGPLRLEQWLEELRVLLSGNNLCSGTAFAELLDRAVQGDGDRLKAANMSDEAYKELKKLSSDLKRRRKASDQTNEKLAKLISYIGSPMQDALAGVPELRHLLAAAALLERPIKVLAASGEPLPQWWGELWGKWQDGLKMLYQGQVDGSLSDLALDVWELCERSEPVAAPVRDTILLPPPIEEEDHAYAEIAAGAELILQPLSVLPPVDDAMTRKLAVEQLHFLAPKGRPLIDRWELASQILLRCAKLLKDDDLERLALHKAPDMSSLNLKMKQLTEDTTVLPFDGEQLTDDLSNLALKHRSGLKERDVVEQPEAEQERIIRIEQGKLDRLMELIGELVVAKNAFPYIIQEMTEPALAQQLKEKFGMLDRISKELQDAIIDVRMLPLSSVFSKFNRFVRDLAKQLGKQINLEISGEETTLDKRLVEVLSEPLIHLVRNAIDHGIETEEERRLTGKLPAGLLRLHAWREGNKVLIEVTDDGRGIDIESIRQKAVELKLLGKEEATDLGSEELQRYIFKAGFTTAEGVTSMSGRGVGLDAVLSNIENMQGKITIQSESGRGTTFTIELPLTLTMTQVLQVQVADQVYGIPLDQIGQTMRVSVDELQSVQGQLVLPLPDQVVPVLELKTYFGLTEATESLNEYRYVAILKNGIGLQVDFFKGQQEVVVKPLEASLRHLAHFTGVSIMGDGTVLLILNSNGLEI